MNFGWAFAGHAVYAACQWGIIAAIARLGSTESVGRFALGLAVTTPVFLFAGLHLRAAQATDAARTFHFRDYLGVRLVGMAAALAATAAVVGLSGYDPETALVVLAVALSKAVEGASDAYYGFLQQHERMRPMAASLVARGALSVGAVAAVLFAGGGVGLATLAVAGCWAIVLLAHDRRVAAPILRALGERGTPRLERRAATRIVVLALPLGFVMLLVALRTNLPRYFVEHGLGAAELGLFAALASFVAAGNLVVSALGQSASPRLARAHYAGDRAAFRRLLLRLVGVAIAIGAAAIAVAIGAGRPLLRVAFGEPYAARSDLLGWLMVAGLLSYVTSFLGYGLTATRRFAVQLPLFAGTAAACAAASALLVPRYGLTGAAWALGASYLLEIALLVVLLRSELGMGRGREATA